MMPKSHSYKHYHSASRRFILGVIENFFERECPKFFGPLLRTALSQKLLDLIESQMPHKDHLRPGQIVWNTTSQATRPDHPELRLAPVILTLVNESDVDLLAEGNNLQRVARKAIARITREAYEQGGLLSMRDIALLTWRNASTISKLRIQEERDQGKPLPHPGSLQDFGSCISHKFIIIHKVVVQGKDSALVAKETFHTQRAVDRYLKDFYRVRSCCQNTPNISFICQVTGMTPRLVKDYVRIIENIEKNA